MARQVAYLVIRADRKARVVTRRPKLFADEVAIKMNLDFPEHWGKVLSDEITVKVPDFAPEVQYEQVSDA